MKPLDLAELVEKSDVIIERKVKDRSTFKSDETGKIKPHKSISLSNIFAGEIERKPVTVEQWGELSQTRKFNVTVEPVNDPPRFIEQTPGGSIDGKEGEKLSFELNAEDIDDSELPTTYLRCRVA